MENDLFRAPEMLLGMLSGALHFGTMILAIVIALKATNKIRGQASTLILIGAIIKLMSGLGGYFLQYFIFRIVDTRDVGMYFMANGLFNGIGSLLFLIGILMLIQQWGKEQYADV